MYRFLLRCCSHIPQHQALYGIKVRLPDNRLMTIFYDNPLGAVVLHTLLDLMVRRAALVLLKLSDIDLVTQDALYKHGAPQCLLILAKAAAVVEALRLLIFHRAEHTHVIEPVSYG